MTRTPGVGLALCVTGAVVWVGVSLAAGVREAWDHSLYWQVGYPLLAVAAGVAAYLDSRFAWRGPLLLAVAQCGTMIVQNVLRSDASFGLLPLGLIVFTLMALPLYVPAYLGAALARHGSSSRLS